MTKVTKPYEPTKPELAKVDKLTRRVQVRPPGPAMSLKVKEDGALSIGFTHEDPDLAQVLLMADTGSQEVPFLFGLMRQIAVMGSHKERVDEDNSNFMLSVVRGLEPRDQMEAMLAAQMAAIHSATMMMARRLNHVETLQQQDAAERALNKLARTYATQMEALKRYRTGGQQTVTVQHVNVADGGQAIVGNVQAGDGGVEKKRR